MITIQSADAALKDYYLDAVSAQLNNNISPFFTAIEKNSDCVSGKDVKLSVVRGYTGNVMAGSEDGDLPNPAKNRYVEICVPLKNIYGTIEISDKALRASRESSGAFVNLINAEMEGLVANAQQNFRRMLFANSSGYLATLMNKIDARTYASRDAKRYFIGMNVDVFDDNSDLATGDSGTYIADVDIEQGRIIFSEDIPVDVTAGEVYLHGSQDNELIGLNALFQGDKIYNHNRKEDSFFQTHDFKADVLTEEKLCEIIDYMAENYNSKINMILCSYKTRRKIAEIANASKRIVNTIDMHAGYGEITINNVPVYADMYCTDNIIYFLNTDDFALYQLCDWEWLEDEDGKILKQVPGKAAYSATLVKYAELVCRKPCGQARLYGYNK